MSCTVSIVEDDAGARESLRELVQQATNLQCLSTFGSAGHIAFLTPS